MKFLRGSHENVFMLQYRKAGGRFSGSQGKQGWAHGIVQAVPSKA